MVFMDVIVIVKTICNARTKSMDKNIESEARAVTRWPSNMYIM